MYLEPGGGPHEPSMLDLGVSLVEVQGDGIVTVHGDTVVATAATVLLAPGLEDVTAQGSGPVERGTHPVWRVRKRDRLRQVYGIDRQPRPVALADTAREEARGPFRDCLDCGYRRVKVRWVTPLGDETASMS